MDTELSSKSSLVDAEMLAKFSNLAPAQVDEFRNSIAPDFLPADYWNAPSITVVGDPESPWQWLQHGVQDAWANFSLDRSIQLITAVDKYSKLEQRLQQIPKISNQEILTIELPAPEVWGFQRAVMFLAVNSWRARFCLGCGKRFVATKPRSTYCTDTCFKENRKDVKRAWWGAHGQELRKSKATRTKKDKKG